MRIDIADFVDRLVAADCTFDRANTTHKLELEFQDPLSGDFIKRIKVFGIDGRILFYKEAGFTQICKWNVQKQQRWIMEILPPNSKHKTLIRVGRNAK